MGKDQSWEDFLKEQQANSPEPFANIGACNIQYALDNAKEEAGESKEYERNEHLNGMSELDEEDEKEKD